MRELTIQTFIYYLIYSGASKGFCKIMQCKEIDLSCSIEIYYFEELLPFLHIVMFCCTVSNKSFSCLSPLSNSQIIYPT